MTALLAPGTSERFTAYFEARGEDLPARYARQPYAPPLHPQWPIPKNKMWHNGGRGADDEPRKPPRHYVRKWI